MPDVSFGYHFARIDANVGVSYRFMQYRFAAFDTRISMRRHSFILEFNFIQYVCSTSGGPSFIRSSAVSDVSARKAVSFRERLLFFTKIQILTLPSPQKPITSPLTKTITQQPVQQL